MRRPCTHQPLKQPRWILRWGCSSSRSLHGVPPTLRDNLVAPCGGCCACWGCLVLPSSWGLKLGQRSGGGGQGPGIRTAAGLTVSVVRLVHQAAHALCSRWMAAGANKKRFPPVRSSSSSSTDLTNCQSEPEKGCRADPTAIFHQKSGPAIALA